ncbi:MAG: transcriptional regulator [Alphaproteobacteria bacterium]|nr:transcriptional regulator [Alphaproteobacteria bacterium]|tara:strand:+ start:13983 stop:14279 length:297 start_codon:yes stop_codon:yes gene_type:complete
MPKMTETMTSATQLLKALANQKRLEILYILDKENEKSVGDILPAVGITQSALSQHLAKLREYNLVKTRRDAQTIYYSIKCDKLRSLLRSIKDLYKEAA